MKEEYIRKVKGHLPLPRQQKREVLRDLEEIFASAGEHGESEAQVLDRLGSPEEYAKEVLTQTGYVPRPGKAALGLALSALVCGVCLALFVWSQSGRLPEDAIGGAVGSTNIQVAAAWTSPLCCWCGGRGAGGGCVVRLAAAAAAERIVP